MKNHDGSSLLSTDNANITLNTLFKSHSEGELQNFHEDAANNVEKQTAPSAISDKSSQNLTNITFRNTRKKK